ncbi:MAG: NAD(+)/NADH kinase [Candidatus Poribacteria bacterium]|nr:NAD(+)/NADH kinase [Candidatus Poribacteria bacterium]
MTSEFKRIGIIFNAAKPDALQTAEKAAAWLNFHGVETVIGEAVTPASKIVMPVTTQFAPIPEVVAQSDLLLVLGGDGTILGVSRIPGAEDVPILAVNLGNVGFLTGVTREELEPALERVMSGAFETSQRMMLEYTVHDEETLVAHGFALNDIVAKENDHLISLDLYIDDDFAISVRGDGMIVSTPTGSTAYSLAMNGPIVHPRCETIMLTPIAPFSMATRPLLVPAQCEVKLVVASESPSGVLRSDGQEQYPLTQGCEIRTWRASKTIKLVRPYHRNFFGVLRAKLHLGSIPTG